VGAVDGTLLDPCAEDRDFLRLHGLGSALRILGHEVVGVGGLDALDEFALFGVARNDGVGVAGPLLHGEFGEVEAESAFAHFGIGTVATEAAGSEDGLDVLIEVEALSGGDGGVGSVATGDT
jgi:hypothetical protein